MVVVAQNGGGQFYFDGLRLRCASQLAMIL